MMSFNFPSTVPAISNMSFRPHSAWNVHPSSPMVQQNLSLQFCGRHLAYIPMNSQHVVPNNSVVPAQTSPFVPGMMEMMKSVPPPTFMPPTFSGNRTPAPPWNSTQVINNNHFSDQSGQFQAKPPSIPNYPPPVPQYPPLVHQYPPSPSANYTNVNIFNGHPNPGIQISNAFQRNQGAQFSNSNSNSAVGYVTNGVDINQINRNPGIDLDINSRRYKRDDRSSNYRRDRSSPNHSRSKSFSYYSPESSSSKYSPDGFSFNSSPGSSLSCSKASNSSNCSKASNSPNYNRDAANCFEGNNTLQSDSIRSPIFGDSTNIPVTSNKLGSQRSLFPMDRNSQSHHNGKKFHQNRNQRRRHISNGSNTFFSKEFNTHPVEPGDRSNLNDGSGVANKKCEGNYEKPRPFSCDTCDRAFNTESDLMGHLAEHVKCNAGNCNFEAHPKIVALHKKMQHDTGYADAINKSKSVEEWRAERRRRFPTAKNIENRKAEQAEKEARGEVIEDKEFGKFKGRNSKQGGSGNGEGGSGNGERINPRKRRRNAQKMRKARKIQEHPHSVSKSTENVYDSGPDSDDDSHIKLPKFLGMRAVYSAEDENLESPSRDLSSNSHELSDNATVKETGNPILMGINVDDDQSPLEPCVEKNTSFEEQSIERESSDSLIVQLDEKSTSEIHCTETDNLSQKQVFDAVVNVNSDDESPVEIPTTKSVAPLKESSEKEMTHGNRHSNPYVDRDFNRNRAYPAVPRKSYLLERLLADDIRHERNVIMQCIRYIAGKNYFNSESITDIL